MKVESGQGTKKEIGSASPNGSRSSGRSVATVSGGVVAVYMVESSWFSMGGSASWQDVVGVDTTDVEESLLAKSTG